MKVAVVGGAGYIGSVAVEQLVERGHDVVILDNLRTGHRAAVNPKAQFVQGDMNRKDDLKALFSGAGIDAVMHFAALSLVGESVEHPGLYFSNNVSGGLNLLDAMLENGVRKIVFSSTCAVYGEPEKSPITEDFPMNPSSPYGDSKLAFEKVLKWYAKAYGLRYASLRYFNAAGATETYGESHDPESHLIPIVLKVARGEREAVTIFGEDYPTPDGTCIRDYIHVTDLAEAHWRALDYLHSPGNNIICNLGTEHGYSVKQVIEAARKVTGKEIPVKAGPRRPGDPPILVASATKAKTELGWSAKITDLEKIIGDAWAWHQKHPTGYPKETVHV